MSQTITLVGCFTVSVTGTFQLLLAQTRSFRRFDRLFNSNGYSSEKSTRLLPWMDRVRRAGAKSSRFCRRSAISLGCLRGFSGFCCRHCR